MNGTEYARVSGSYNTAWIGTWSLLNQDIANNKSTIRLYGYFYYGGGTQVVSSYSTFQLNGTTIKSGSYTYTPGYHLIGTKDIVVSHNNDGTFPATNVSIYASSYHMNGSSNGTIQYKGVADIPRASSVSCSSPYIGDTAVITIGKKVTNFTSTVTYEIGTIKGTLAEKSSETIFQLETSSIKEEIYALIPNDKKIMGTITCTTYNGDTQIGEPTTATFNLYAVEEDCKPIVTGEVVDTNESTIALTGDSSVIVKNASKPKVTITATPLLSSTIKSYSINLNDGQTASEQEYTFDTINSNKITVSATDSREYPNHYDIDLTDRVVDYVKLHFNSIPELIRPEGTSNEVILDCDGVWFNGNFSEETQNTLIIRFQYRLSGETEWIDGGEIIPTVDGNKFSFNNYSLGNLFDYNSEYQFKIIATDLLMTVGNTNKEAISVPKGQEVWFECEDGIGVYGHIWLNGKNILDIIYPIGSLYISTNETNPKMLFGGTWEQIKDTFLLGAGDTYNAGATGGEAEHTLTIEEMPSHTHKQFNRNWYVTPQNAQTNTAGNADGEMEALTSATGGGQAHNNMPPYLTVYMWKRIA